MTPVSICVTQDDNGTFLITMPGLPEVTTFAETWGEIPARAADAALEAVAAREAALVRLLMDAK